jgi:hypothetical protein
MSDARNLTGRQEGAAPTATRLSAFLVAVLLVAIGCAGGAPVLPTPVGTTGSGGIVIGDPSDPIIKLPDQPVIDAAGLPSVGAKARLVNLYSENGQRVTVDVYGYAWSTTGLGEVGALVATVPYGQASDWFNPGLVQSPFDDNPYTRLDIYKSGDRSNPLVGVGEFLGAGTVATVAVWQEEVFEGEPGAWREVIYSQHPDYEIPQANAGEGLLLGRDVGLRAQGDPPTLYASVGKGCLESTLGRSDPDFPNVQPLSNPLSLPVGQNTLTVHEEKTTDIPSCKTKPLGPGAPINVAAGDRLIAFPYKLPGAGESNLLVLPFDAP